MPIVTFHPSGKKVEISEGITLFEAAQQANLPVASSCHTDFICGRCNMQVRSGAEKLSKQSEAERNLLRREKKDETDRISCQTKVFGDCEVTTTYW